MRYLLLLTFLFLAACKPQTEDGAVSVRPYLGPEQSERLERLNTNIDLAKGVYIDTVGTSNPAYALPYHDYLDVCVAVLERRNPIDAMFYSVVNAQATFVLEKIYSDCFDIRAEEEL